MSGRSVVDTNVLVAANGRGTHVDIACQLGCVEELAKLSRDGIVCVDDRWLIMGEYGRRTAHGGQPGPGTQFYIELCQKMHDPKRVCLVPVQPVDPKDTEGRDFSDPDLPPNNLKKDAKFLAVAVKAHAVIVNASDSDWNEHAELTNRLGVDVRQLCPQHANRAGAK